MKFIVTAEAGYHGFRKPTLWLYSETEIKKIATFINEDARQEYLDMMQDRIPVITRFKDENLKE